MQLQIFSDERFQQKKDFKKFKKEEKKPVVPEIKINYAVEQRENKLERIYCLFNAKLVTLFLRYIAHELEHFRKTKSEYRNFSDQMILKRQSNILNALLQHADAPHSAQKTVSGFEYSKLEELSEKQRFGVLRDTILLYSCAKFNSQKERDEMLKAQIEKLKMPEFNVVDFDFVKSCYIVNSNLKFNQDTNDDLFKMLFVEE